VKLIKIAGLAVAGVLILAVLVLSFGIPGAPLMGYIGDQAEKAGYRLQVGGSSKISLWPYLNVSAGDIRLAEAKDAREEVLTAKQVRVGVSLLSLFTGNVRVTEVDITQPVVRVTSGRGSSVSRRTAAKTDTAESAMRSVVIDRFTVEDGTLILRDVKENLEGRLTAIKLTASVPVAQGSLDVKLDGKAGDQALKVSAKAGSLSQIVEGKSTPVEATVEMPGLLAAPLSVTANFKATDQVVNVDGVRGTLGSGRVNGTISADMAGAKPYINASMNFERLELLPAAASSGGQARDEPWSDQPLEFAVLRVFDAAIKLSAREFIVRNIHIAPAEVEANLSGGLFSLLLSRADLYGGPVQGKIVIDAATREPRHGFSLQLGKVNALALLTDAFGFDHLEGRFNGSLDVTGSGTSPRAIVASLGGTADFSVEDGAIRDVNVPGMVRALSNQTLKGWQEKGTEKTDLSALTATFRVSKGLATADNLRLAGPLVRMTGKGTADLVARTLDFRVEPKLVLTLQGQGGPNDPAGLGVPVVIRGSWSDPQIYPDIAGILDNPDAAFAKLKSMGGSLFGLLDPQPGSGGKKPGAEDVIKSLDQIIRGDGRKPSDTKNQVRDVIRDLLGR
jgi:AsmA protein